MKRSHFAIPCLAILLGLSSLPLTANGQAGGDVKRRTIAITYFKDPIKVQMAGTTLRPTAHGEATVERWRKRNETQIKLTVEDLIPAYNYGGDFTTYVLWAITPEGQVSNLGEFRLTGGTGHLYAATPYQTFAMIITAEPYYLVKLPSTKVVLTNQAPNSKKVEVQSSEIYFTGDSGRYYTDTSIPATADRDYARIPAELLQARRAVQIAKLAGGDEYDRADLKTAADNLQNAEGAYSRGADVHEVGRISRDAISFAEKTREIAEERSEAAARRADIERRDEEVRKATENASDLQVQLQDTQTKLRASELSRQNSEDQLNRSMREAADLRAQNHTLQNENDDLKGDNEKLSKQLAGAQAQIATLQGQLSDASSKLSTEATRAAAAERDIRETKEAENRRRDFDRFRTDLSAILTVKPSSDGFAATIPDSYFLANRTELNRRVKEKMDEIGKLLADHPNVKFTVQGYWDASANAEILGLGRAKAVGDYIAAFGIPKDSF
ncbi:MAG TPA: OmpA family protein, partial [Blastocatellia bacterium]|nr:OmpA family protein [Blastocatellia bacterium]